MKKAIVLVGLGYGDESKGSWTDYLTREYEAELVIRYSGGSQCGHNVQLPDGTRHTFSQFGAGTFAGACTYLGPQVIVNPYALKNETEALYKAGVKDIAGKLWAHPQCLITTVFHQWLNQLKELARSADPNSEKRHGSCGHGIGETRSYWLKHGEEAVFAGDLNNAHVLHSKLELMRQRMMVEVAELSPLLPHSIRQKYDFYALAATNEAVILSQLAKSYMTLSRYPQDFEVVVFEGAQGVLLDEWHGFHPYTTWSTVGPHHALEMTWDMGIEEVCMLGLCRSYMTRHGAGPFPTYDKKLTEKLTDPGNPHNQWQGDMRCGHLDLPLLKYSKEVCGGLSGLLVSHLDQVDSDTMVNESYTNSVLDIKIKNWPMPNLDMQRKLGERLEGLLQKRLVSVDEKGLIEKLREHVAPVLGVAKGPTHNDREMADLPFRKRIKNLVEQK